LYLVVECSLRDEEHLDKVWLATPKVPFLVILLLRISSESLENEAAWMHANAKCHCCPSTVNY
jgi:hypothetical protein